MILTRHFTTKRWFNGKLSLRVDDIWWNTVDGQPPSSICSLPCAFGYFEQSIPGEAECCWTCEQCGPEQASDGKTCMTCPPGEKPDQLRQSCKRLRLEVLDWSHPLAIILLIVSLLGAVITIAFMVVFAIFRSWIIKATSKELSVVILCVILLCYLLLLIYIGTPHAVSCAFRHYGIGVCLSLCFDVIFVKLSRIHRIFNQKKLTTKVAHFIDCKLQLVFTAIIVVLRLLVGVAHTVHVTSNLYKSDKFRGIPLRIPVNCPQNVSALSGHQCIPTKRLTCKDANRSHKEDHCFPSQLFGS